MTDATRRTLRELLERANADGPLEYRRDGGTHMTEKAKARWELGDGAAARALPSLLDALDAAEAERERLRDGLRQVIANKACNSMGCALIAEAALKGFPDGQ